MELTKIEDPKLYKFLKKYVNQFGLQHWKLSLVHGKLEPHEDGEIDIDGRDFSAVITLQENQTYDQYEETIIHELLHIVFEEVDDIVTSLKTPETEKIINIYDDYIHKIISRLTQIILPKKNERKRRKI